MADFEILREGSKDPNHEEIQKIEEEQIKCFK